MITGIAQITVLIFGIVVILLAAWGVFAPRQLMQLVTSVMDRAWGIHVAVIVRLVLGVALITVAAESLFPVIFQVLGSIAIVAAVVLALAGRERLRSFVAWWSGRFSTAAIRLWLLFGVAFGGFVVYGVI